MGIATISLKKLITASLFLLSLLLIPLSVNAQQMDLRGNSEYVEGQCPANDIEILAAMVDLGTTCNDCTPGSTVTGDLIITVRHGTNSQNRYLAVMGDLTETFPDGTSSMSTFAECSGPLETQNNGNNGVQELNFGEVTFMCGSELVLDNILLVWTAANGECPVTPANNPNGKYCYANPTINITPPLNAMASASCSTGNMVDIDLTVQGGVPPFTYLWSNGATTEDLTNVTPGTYSVVATDSEGCTAPASITIGPSLSGSISGTDVLCFGEATGSADLTVTGGVPPYTYSWDNGATTEDISGLTAGTYMVTVTDDLGCEITESVTITEPTELTCSAVQDSPASSGNSDGVATVTPAGGTPPYTYLWDNGETTPTATGLNGGLHTVTVTDANGCETTCQVTIQELDPLECTVALENDVLCNGESTGSATVTPTGGVAPYTYSWDNGETTQTATGLDAGLHTVTVTDDTGAQTTCDVTIGEPDALSSSTTQVDVLCFGEATGSIDLTVSGGTAPYSYAWDNGAITEDLSGLTAGTYNVTITDANGCETTDSVTITEPTDLTCTVDLVSNVTINGGNDGIATVEPSGGTAPYTYLWDNGSTSEQPTNLDAGVHTVTVTDANGCETTCEITITEPDALACTVALVQDEQCFGDEDGSATANPVGGVAPYSYSWDNGETTQTATGLAQGLHTVTVIDANGAQTSCEITIGGPSEALSSSTTQVDVLCFGDATGSVDLTVSGGTAPYTYSWDNGATTEDISGLTAGTYNVTITDANGCETTDSVTITEPTDLTCSVTLDSGVTVNGASDGVATVNPSGGTAPYTYLWDNGETTQQATGLNAGLHTVTVTDANGCETTCEVTVTQPDELTCTVALVSDVLCNGESNGSATVTPVGGVAPYTYSWDNGETTQTATALNAGLHTVTVTDANGAQTSCDVTIGEPEALSSSTTQVDVLCFGEATGSIDLTVSGGTAPYSYAWDNGATTEDLSGLTAGTYNVTITDANGCETTDSVTITEPTDLTCSVTLDSGVTVNGASDGVATVNPSGGTAPYTYLWDNGETTQQATGLNAGLHTVTVTDANGCETTCEVTVTQPDELTCTVALVSDVLCNGESNGSATVTPVGGVAPYTYSWDNGETTQTATALNAGLHTVTVTDANGAQTSCDVTIGEPDVLQIGLVPTGVLCFGEATGAVDLTVSGGTAPYTYLWSNGAATEDISGLTAGTYAVLVTDVNGCEASMDVMVGQPDAPLALSAQAVDVLCFGEATGSIDITVSGGTAPYTYSWDNGATTEDISSLVAGTYNVTVTDANGCEETESVTIIQPDEELTCSVALDMGVSVNGASDGAATVDPMGGTAPYTYAWDNGETTQQATGLNAGLHTVTVTDANGCETTCEVTVPEPDQLVCNITLESNVLCNGDSDGSATVNPMGGVMPYTYAWDNGETTQTAVALNAGVHTVTVTDANGAQTSCEVTISEPAELTCTTLVISNVTINGGMDGIAEVIPAGGTAPYTYLWDNGSTSDQPTNLDAGVHVVTVTDANGCETTCEVTVTEPDELTCSVDLVNDVTCNGGNDGSATANPVGGVAPFTYAWDNGETTQTAVMLTAGLHTVIVTDTNGAQTSCEITITEPDPPNAGDDNMTRVCDGTIVDLTTLVSELGGTFSDPGATGGLSGSDFDTTGLGPGSYDLIYTVEGATPNCPVDTATITVIVDELADAGMDNETTVCDGEVVDLTTLVSVMGGTFSDPGLTGGLSGTNFDTSGLSPGNYDLIYTVGSGNQNCPDDTATITVNVDVPADAGADNSTEVCESTIVDLSTLVSVMGGTFSDPNMTGGLSGSSFDTTGLTPGLYEIIYTVPSGNTCPDDTATITISVLEDIVTQTCEVLDIDFCNPNEAPFYNFFWFEMPSDSRFFSQSGSNSLSFTEFTDGTALIEGTTQVGTCVAEVYIVLKDLKDWTQWSADGGTFKPQGCDKDAVVKEDLRYYVIDGTKSTITTSGGDCVEENTFIVTQRPDPDDPNTPNLGVHIGPGGALYDSDTTAEGLAGWGWMGPQGDEQRYRIDFNFHIDCEDETGCEPKNDLECRIDSAVQEVSCYGGNDGSATVSGIGGTAPYTYLWDNGETTATATMLTAGSHSVVVFDADGFKTDCSVEIGHPEELSCETTLLSGVSADGAMDGSATVTPDGGTAPYTYLWDNGESTQTATALSAGSHSVKVIDANQCETVCYVEILDAGQFICRIAADISSVSCFGGNDGSATVTPIGGLAPYSYAWDNGETTATATMLTAGMHQVTVMDANGRETTCDITIETPEELTCEATVFSNVSTNGGSDGSATATPMGGTAPFTYLWDNGETTSMAVALDAGVHEVTITDANGCETSCEVTIMEPDSLSCTAEKVSDALCHDSEDGSAQVMVNGGTPPYSYSWDNGETTQTAVGLAPGMHTVTVTDNNGVETTCNVTIGAPSELTATATLVSEVSVNGMSDGSATVTPSGGTPPYTYLWDNGETTQTAVMLSAGMHTVMVIDANGCETVAEVEIPTPDALMCTVMIDSHVLCNGDANGSATVMPTGGVTPYTYLWDNGETGQTATALNAGVHSVTVTDANGAETTCEVTVEEPMELTATASEVSAVSDIGEEDGIATVSASGGTPPYTYLWDNGETSQMATMLSAGVHTVTVTDANGCEAMAEVTITAPGVFNCEIGQVVHVLCNGDATGGATVMPVGGAAPYTYLWSNGEAGQEATMLTAGVHSVIVTDANGRETTCEITIEEPPLLTCEIIDVVNSNEGEDNGEATVAVGGGVGPYTFLWDDPSAQTTQSATGLAPGTYNVVVIDQNGCETSCEVTIEEIPDTQPTGCQTAYGRYAANNSCFIDDGIGANRWGWTNYFASEGTYTMDLHSAAGQCDLSKGTKTGEVTVEYSNGVVTVSAEMLPGFVMTQAHLYVGDQPYPLGNNGRPTVANGQLGNTKDPLNNVTTVEFDPIDVSGFADGVHVIFHAVTCERTVTKKVAQTVVTPYPLTFNGRLNLQIEIDYSAFAKVEFFDMRGRLVLSKREVAIKKGKNDLSFDVVSLAPDMYIMVVNTGKEKFKMKVMARK